MRFVGVLLLLVAACESSPNSHRRIRDAQGEPAYSDCWAENGGPTSGFGRAFGDELYLECASEADRLVPEAGEFWECRANEVEGSVECLEMLGCDSESWDVCTSSTCTLSEEAELDWTCTMWNCQWDGGLARPTAPSHPCDGWSPDD